MGGVMAAKVDKKKCTGCGICVDICPVQAIKIEKEKAVINDDCVECGACVNECPNGALSIP
jgi:ferredoxin